MHRWPSCRTLPRPVRRRAACLLAVLVAALGGCQNGTTPPPGTPPATRASETPTIRVKIGESVPQVRVTVREKYQIYDLGTKQLLLAGDSLPGGVFAVTGGKLLLDGRPLGTPQVTVAAEKGGSIAVAGQAYHGNLRVLAEAGNVTLVNCVNLDDYLAGVVGAELYKGWHLEANRAQAIVARSYALYQVKNPRCGPLYDVTDSPATHQAYRGVSGETATSREAAVTTRGVVVTTDEAGPQRIFEAFFSSTCGGHTVPAHTRFASAPRIKPFQGVACAWCTKSPNYLWSRKIGGKDLAARLQQADAALNLKSVAKAWVSKDNLTAEGCVKGVWVAGDRGPNFLVSTKAFKACFPEGQRVLSDRFAVTVSGGEVVVNGRGNGHGIGLCQYGAQELATQGHSAEEILAYYYPGSILARVY